MPRVEEFASPSELILLNAAIEAFQESKSVDEGFAVLDQLLGKAAEPTQFRGIVQLIRAETLGQVGRSPEAVQAIEESIRLLPGYSAPLISAAIIHGYANEPAKAADFLLRAIELDPESVRSLDDYEVFAILRGLKYAAEDARQEAVSDRLLQIGWVGRRLTSQSSLASEAIGRRLKEGDIVGARSLVSKLLVPSHSYNLLSRREFIAVWPEIERWAGPKLSNQWSMYLREARERWASSKSVDTVQDYTNALLGAGHYESVIRDVYPLLLGKLDRIESQDLIFVISGVASALAMKGRWDDADALFERTQKVWPLESQANAINIAGNRARYLLFSGKLDEALRYADLALAEGIKKKVNPDALTEMHVTRACILHELGRIAEADASTRLALVRAFPGTAANLHLCRGDDEAAKRALLQGLKDPARRTSVITFLQPDENDDLLPSKYAHAMAARRVALKADPELRSSVEEYARILPFTLDEGAPKEEARK
jgi:tetratricopeptide (TPR) repeat protein